MRKLFNKNVIVGGLIISVFSAAIVLTSVMCFVGVAAR